MKFVKFASWLSCAFCLFCFNTLNAEESAKALTLEVALAEVDAHPDFQAALAERNSALADRDSVASRKDLSLNFEGILRSGEQHNSSTYDTGFLPDNSVRLTARKTLYDFGRSSAAEQAANAEVSAREADLLTSRERRRLDIMSRYFDVLLADMQYTADNELMAAIYVAFDHGRDNFAAGKISSLDLAEMETKYQDTYLIRTASLQRQRISRALLANALNRPGDLPGDLVDPNLVTNNRILPDYDKLLPVLLQNNPRLKAQEDLLVASQSRLESLRAEKGPTLDAEVQAADYSRTSALRDNLSAGLILSWPLYQGSRTDSRVAKEYAQQDKNRAILDKLKMDLTQSMLETYLEIEQLQSVGRSAAQKLVDYRDLTMERSRGLYELELRSNLGTSMTESFTANLRVRRNEYQLALDFARLEAILGKPLEAKYKNEAKGKK
ncbi:MAG: TolC family protein [Gallionellaceae bacterium]|jgi:outer membrane protein TolC